MAEDPVSHAYKHEDLIVLMLRDKGIHDGRWMLQIRFGLGAGNAGPSLDQMNPTAFVPVMSIGLVQTQIEGPLIVDASKANPVEKPRRKPAQ